jgi:hypothetical protein
MRHDTCRLDQCPNCTLVGGFKFSQQGTGCWFEGAAHVATAFNYLARSGGDTTAGTIGKARSILEEIVRANPIINRTSHGGISAACSEPAWTGFNKEFRKGIPEKWTYPARVHLGASAWFILASRGVNPYWLAIAPVVRQ